jgi:hypothetical protein
VPRPLAVLVLLLVAAACSRQEFASAKRTYNAKTGRLETLSVDVNKNGRQDGTSFMDGTRIIRVELDLDENGKIERWDIYNPDRSLQKVGLATRNDGVMDSQAFYSPGGVLQRIEISTKRDGRFDRTEFYSDAEVLLRSEEDTNADGRPDKWDTYGPVKTPVAGVPPYTIVRTAFDETGTGKPTRRVVFGADGSIVLVEVDADGDGQFTRVGPPIGRSTK